MRSRLALIVYIFDTTGQYSANPNACQSKINPALDNPRSASHGRIEGMERRAGSQVIRGIVPLAEMFGYATHMGSITQVLPAGSRKEVLLHPLSEIFR